MKIKGCRGELLLVLFAVVIGSIPVYVGIYGPGPKQNSGFNGDNFPAEVIILSNPANMPSSGMGMGF
jgi:hypothetical protein